MRFANIIAVAASLLTAVSAAPAPIPTTRPPSPVTNPNPPAPKVTVPSVAELMTAFEPVMKTDSSLFYTGNTKLAAVDFIREQKKDLNHEWLTLGHVWNKMAVYDANYWQKVDRTLMSQEDAEKEYALNSSVAFAKASKGKVIVTIPADWDPTKAATSVWERAEKPALLQLKTSGQVTSIVARKYKKENKKWVFVEEGPAP